MSRETVGDEVRSGDLTVEGSVSFAGGTDLSTALAAKASLAGATYTGTHDFSGATVTGAGGLIPIWEETWSSQSSVSLDNVFTSAYDNYRVIGRIVPGSAGYHMTMRWRASSADNSAASYNWTVLSAGGSSSSVASSSAATSARVMYLGSGAQAFAWDVIRPYVSGQTISISTVSSENSGPYLQTVAHRHGASASFDGFSLLAGVNFSGVLAVYGYMNP